MSPAVNGVWAAIVAVFSAVASWFKDAVGAIVPIFYDAETSNLTLLGTLGVIALAISIIFLLVHFVMQFFHLRAN